MGRKRELVVPHTNWMKPYLIDLWSLKMNSIQSLALEDELDCILSDSRPSQPVQRATVAGQGTASEPDASVPGRR